MNEKQKELLKNIVNDKFSVGAFSGMIFNASLQCDEPIDKIIERALSVRLIMMELIK